MDIALYHFWSDTASQRIRMVLHAKSILYQDIPLSYWDDETFFELGVGRTVPIVKLENDSLLFDSEQILWQSDDLFNSQVELAENVIDLASWQALLQWRHSVAAVLERLLAPALLSYRDIAEDQNSIAQYKASIQKKYGLSAEALANDRYASYDQFARMTNLSELAKHLAKKRFYMGQLSIADIVLTADLFPLQCLDGVTLPIDFLYYLQRVQEACNIDLQQGLVINLG